jgi:hypothetical protein
MEINRAATLAKVFTRDRALEARDRRDDAIRRLGLSDQQAYPGSAKFPQAMEVTIKYMEDLVDAKLSSIEAAYTQTRTPLTGETVVEASAALKSTLDEIVSARVASWNEALSLNRQRTRVFDASDSSALAEAKREISRQAARLHEKADAKLDVLLQTSLANSEKSAPSPNRDSRTAVVLRVLIASPSDVLKYRDLLTSVVHEWNDVHSLAQGVVLMPVKWETHAHPDTGDYPQGIINKQIVNSCDIVIGVFWSRLGTRTPVAESGTAEEIERLRSRGKPVLLYFSKEPLPQSHDPLQWQKLKEYQQQLQSNTLYWEFEDPADLHRLASKHLASVVHELTTGVANEFAPALSPQARDRRANLVLIEETGSFFIRCYTPPGHVPRSETGTYLELWASIENKGDRHATITQYAVRIDGMSNSEQLRPTPMNYIPGRNAQHALNISEVVKNYIEVPAERLAAHLHIPFMLKVIAAPDAREITCELTITDTEGNTATAVLTATERGA